MQETVKHFLFESQTSELAGETARALQLAERALAEARAEADPTTVAEALVRLATVRVRFGQFDDARNLTQAALDLAPPESLARAAALCRLGAIAAETNDLNSAESLLRQALDLYRQLGSRGGIVMALHNLGGNVYLPRGQFTLALAAEEEASRLALEDHHHYLINSCILLTWICIITGDRQRAHQFLERSFALAPSKSWATGYSVVLAADLAMDEEDLSAAHDYLQRGRSIADRSGEPSTNILVKIALSRWYLLQSDLPAAMQWATDAVTFANRVGYRHLEGKALIRRAQVAIASQSLETAEADVRSALAVLTPLGANFDEAHAILLLAVISRERESPDAEDVWLEAARAIREGGYGFLLERERSLAFPLLAEYLASRRAEVRETAESLLEHLARVPPAPLHIVGLGTFQVRQGHRVIPARAWQKRKAGELFRYLLLQPNYSATRDLIWEALWPGCSQASVQQLFHQATSAVRRVLEPDLPDKFPSRYLEVEADRVTLNLPPGSTMDFERFEKDLACALATSDFTGIRETLALYVNALFPGDLHSDWSARLREQLAQLHVRGLLALAQAQLAAQQPGEALDLCNRILEREPWHEDAVLVAMRACLAINDRPRALRLYHQLEQTLSSELNLPPRKDLKDLIESLRVA